MTPERWKLVKSTFDLVSELPVLERDQALEEACNGDRELHSAVKRLLASDQGSGGFLDQPPCPIGPALLAEFPLSSIQLGQTLGSRFRLQSLLGRGGMGEVYSAYDLRLKRLVALKIIATEFASNRDYQQRLRREAHLISTLEHPNICRLYDLCCDGDTEFLVMELLTGRSLKQMLAARSLPLQPWESLEIAGPIARALAYAHAHGVVHRDLKPSNVMLTPDGVKLVDFGIAKRYEVNTGKEEQDTSLTNGGISGGRGVGTPDYMAPEQANGEDSDSRVDIYALGLLLFEMMTGRRFIPLEQAQSQFGTTSASLREFKVPAAIATIIDKCTAPDRKERWQNAQDLRYAMELVQHYPRLIGEVKAAANPYRGWVSAGVLALATIALVFASIATRQRVDGTHSSAIEFLISPPLQQQFLPIESHGGAAISPDGSAAVFTAAKSGDPASLWVRRFGTAVPQSLAGTEGASHPFWSPDGGEIAFFAEGQLKSVSILNGSVRVVCAAAVGRGGTWGESGDIIFSSGLTQPLHRVSARGGTPTPFTSLDWAQEENSHRWPQILPGGEQVLFLVRSSRAAVQGIYIASIKTGKRRRVRSGSTSAVYAEGGGGAGYLLYAEAGMLTALAFDASRGSATGEPRAIAPWRRVDGITGASSISAARNRTIVYGGGLWSSPSLEWLDSKGRQTKVEAAEGLNRFVRIAPDGNQVAVERVDLQTGRGSIWILDQARGVTSRFSSETESAFSAVWSPRSDRIAYAVSRRGGFDLRVKDVGADGKGISLLPSELSAIPTDWPASDAILFDRRGVDLGWDIWAFALATGTAHQVVAGEGDQRAGRVSPDGRLIAFQSNASGRMEIYTLLISRPAPHTQVSRFGGTQPAWSRKTAALYYLSSAGELHSVKADSNGNPGLARALFAIPPVFQPGTVAGASFDVSSLSDSFLVVRPGVGQRSEPIVVLTNWSSRLHD